MAPIQYSGEGIDRTRVLHRLEELYKSGFVGKDEFESTAAKIARASIEGDIFFTPKAYDPSITIPRILQYLRDNDANRDVNWDTSFPLIQGYIAEATQQMITGGLGFSNPKLRAALEDAHVMLRAHLTAEKRANGMTQWTDGILRGQITQQRLLTYPEAFPLPDPDRANSQHRPVKPTSRPDDVSPLWPVSLKILEPTEEIPVLAEVDNYIETEENFFKAVQQSVKSGEKLFVSPMKPSKFIVENRTYERYMTSGIEETRSKPPPPYSEDSSAPKDPQNPDGTKGQSFYRRRGWQRAALQQCLNLFTSSENRAVNTPWRRPVMPYEPSAPQPNEIAYVSRVVNSDRIDEKEKDPFSWLHWSTQYAQIVDFLADCQRRQYNDESWDNHSASALPANFRGPHIYRGLSVHDQHWLRIGQHLENMESLLHTAWGVAPRPLLRAILRDIDAGKHQNTGGPYMNNSAYLPVEDNDDLQDRKRYWRRDIRRRFGIDSREDNTEDANYKLIDEFEVAWLRYLCEPSRTLEMCDPAKLPSHNLAIVFDTKLQSFFENLEVSGGPDCTELSLWAENRFDIEDIMRNYEPTPFLTVLAYINGCAESELMYSGDTDPNPEHPNSCYQFSVEEAEFLCVELQQLGRCIYIPERGDRPARIGRPSYTVHPEDRVTWRYENSEHFHESNTEYVGDIASHYDQSYGNWSLYHGDRPRFSRELEFMVDHAGPDFTPELERLETQEKQSTATATTKRREFIHKYLVPETLFSIGSLSPDSIESERDSPHPADLATWEAVGVHLTKYHEQIKKQRMDEVYYYSGEPYFPQTPERTVQFFRNLAYRMGRTMRYVDEIKERLQVLEKSSSTGPSKAPLDLSADLQKPRPANNMNTNLATTFNVVEKWWQPVSAKNYDLAVNTWITSIAEDSGEIALMPPNVTEVLAKADPDSSSQNPLKGNQDPFTVIREGIIDDCFRNRPTMYPGRLIGLKDEEDKEFQGYGRPNLFVWATKDQRRYQAQHTRRHFFNMQRWPSSRILPHRLEAIRERKDEVRRVDPSKPDQAYGILTNRLPIGKEKPLYAHPILDHHHRPDIDDWTVFDEHRLPATPKPKPTRTKPNQSSPITPVDDLFADGEVTSPSVHSKGSSSSSSNDDDSDSLGAIFKRIGKTSSAHSRNVISVNTVTIDENPVNINPFSVNLFKTPTSDNNMKSTGKMGMSGQPGVTRPKRPQNFRGLISFRRSDERFAPGPAIFPMGDTLLQKVMISEELNSALYPPQPFYKEPLMGLSKVWKAVAGAPKALVPLVPPVAKSNIPRSNPRKRKMPIEFLNGPKTKKFRSDNSVPLQRGGNGGQFAAGTLEVKSNNAENKREETEEAKEVDVKTERATSVTPVTPKQYTPAMQLPTPSMTGKAKDNAEPESLRQYPDPRRSEAHKPYYATFTNGMMTSLTKINNMYFSGLMALRFSINRQLKPYGIKTTFEELKAIAESKRYSNTLGPYLTASKFDLFALNYLLEVFGNRYGMQLQLGTIQGGFENLDTREGRRTTTRLVGSKYHSHPQKTLVWVALDMNNEMAGHENPYSGRIYNSYLGVGAKSEGIATPPSDASDAEAGNKAA
ncbi:hypothetical protein NPX13_g834 [Xylaria arbuscula]|uniref:Uncharacterized protein n=1 Tax=Xylaria arbuscula TaxID=114810 RepID=A0A9W8NNK9_9PEZI|nr:hypothetical protein NPX13_g834 [Xylaria arbuscula]